MAKTPPFYPQETDFSCAVACLRMVLSHLDVSKSEAELRELCDCMILGTAAVELVLAARKLGFAASSKQARLKKAAKSATGRAIRANDPDRANDPLRSY